MWEAVSNDAATQIREYLHAGDRLQALLTLDALATEIAPLEPGIGHHNIHRPAASSADLPRRIDR